MSKTRAFVPARREIRAKVGKTCKKKLENVAPAAFTNHGTEQELHPPA